MPKMKTYTTDPDGCSNVNRAAWAASAVAEFQAVTGSDDEDAVADLLGDLMHLCARKSKKYGTFEECLRRAEEFFGYENRERTAQ